ncbi:MAG: T9SS type A sorting domain-containing protein [Ignavibacteriae bacterium]|nr:T9SS type A sorting domain-containing protein [Ignavibacteriota bacterium]
MTIRNIILSLVFTIACLQSLNSQVVNIPLIISEGSAGTDTLWFGLDPSATDGIDPFLGESQLPPVPPTGAYDVRFVGTNLTPPPPLGEGVKRDYRQGSANYTGLKNHQLKFQRSNQANNISIRYSLPQGVNGRIFDLYGGVVVNDTIYGTGTVTVTNNVVTSLQMRVNYNLATSVNSTFTNIPEDVKLSNYPNPFNSETKISFAIQKKSDVKISIYSIEGRLVEILTNGIYNAGNYSLSFRGGDLSSGVYICSLQIGNTRKSIMIMQLK